MMTIADLVQLKQNLFIFCSYLHTVQLYFCTYLVHENIL